MGFKDCPEEAALAADWKTLERRRGEAAQERKCGCKIVEKRLHFLAKLNTLEEAWQSSSSKKMWF